MSKSSDRNPASCASEAEKQSKTCRIANNLHRRQACWYDRIVDSLHERTIKSWTCCEMPFLAAAQRKAATSSTGTSSWGPTRSRTDGEFPRPMMEELELVEDCAALLLGTKSPETTAVLLISPLP